MPKRSAPLRHAPLTTSSSDRLKGRTAQHANAYNNSRTGWHDVACRPMATPLRDTHRWPTRRPEQTASGCVLTSRPCRKPNVLAAHRAHLCALPENLPELERKVAKLPGGETAEPSRVIITSSQVRFRESVITCGISLRQETCARWFFDCARAFNP